MLAEWLAEWEGGWPHARVLVRACTVIWTCRQHGNRFRNYGDCRRRRFRARKEFSGFQTPEYSTMRDKSAKNDPKSLK